MELIDLIEHLRIIESYIAEPDKASRLLGHEVGDLLQMLRFCEQECHAIQLFEFCHQLFEERDIAVVVNVRINELRCLGQEPSRQEQERSSESHHALHCPSSRSGTN